MQNLYKDTRKLDASCRASYGISDEIMMENAAFALEEIVRNPCTASKGRAVPQKILIMCGSGNNGADGYTLARRLRFDYDVSVIQFFEPNSKMCKKQAERAEKCGVRLVKREDLSFYDLRFNDIIVDCVFGSGFHGDIDDRTYETMNDINSCMCFKIACDVPSGLREDGTVADGTFAADVTVTMGALKTCLYSDFAKDYVGKIVCGNLGINRRLFENSSSSNLAVGSLLEESDLVLPHRSQNNVNKGSFGHVAVVCGEKTGAALLASSAALRFGAGLLTVVCAENEEGASKNLASFPELMLSSKIPENAKSLAVGMGLGRGDGKAQPFFDYLILHQELKCVLDADAFYDSGIKNFLNKKESGVVLTPHPKEFQILLKNCGAGEFSIDEILINRLALVEKFCRSFPKKTLLLKGSNVVIGYYDGFKYKMFINPLGKPCLAKGGSGDVLSGMAAALLAQNRNSLDAAIGASLAHALASAKIKCDYAMAPQDLISALSEL